MQQNEILGFNFSPCEYHEELFSGAACCQLHRGNSNEGRSIKKSAARGATWLVAVSAMVAASSVLGQTITTVPPPGRLLPQSRQTASGCWL
jgi:hypothetical protein